MKKISFILSILFIIYCCCFVWQCEPPSPPCKAPEKFEITSVNTNVSPNTITFNWDPESSTDTVHLVATISRAGSEPFRIIDRLVPNSPPVILPVEKPFINEDLINAQAFGVNDGEDCKPPSSAIYKVFIDIGIDDIVMGLTKKEHETICTADSTDDRSSLYKISVDFLERTCPSLEVNSIPSCNNYNGTNMNYIIVNKNIYCCLGGDDQNLCKCMLDEYIINPDNPIITSLCTSTTDTF